MANGKRLYNLYIHKADMVTQLAGAVRRRRSPQEESRSAIGRRRAECPERLRCGSLADGHALCLGTCEQFSPQVDVAIDDIE